MKSTHGARTFAANLTSHLFLFGRFTRGLAAWDPSDPGA